ncbi:unnamed protein product [Rotaria sp. Silwood1]|nr:unnamed protein product [Rotaria sp. Silwood1]CAF3488787.1 unnamed protein product [Rotaria sp. Silwood1]CAF3557384.1 unnamed protein product [Rotaria sp. Silwood1]CAF4639599.1 unnamed protein product [Rotaria sp. Silwood1]CAF4697153.1 unnamed protein product [Rotaria sp. Silwood1]
MPAFLSTTKDTMIQSLQPSECSLMKLAKEFVDSLNWPKSLFDETHNRCFCTDCYPSTWENLLLAVGSHYVIPRGWTRLGLHVDPMFKEEHNIWNKWIVTFHGTTKIAARSILTHRHFYLPGDKLIDGTILGIREGHIPNQKFIFTSPTIVYSSLSVYSSKNSFYSHVDRTNYEVQMVLQCRQQPGSFQVQGETVGARSIRICPYIPNEKIEYFTDIRSSIVAYGLLVRMKAKSGIL